MRVIVFGATGGLGSAVVTQALQGGHDVTAFVRSAAKVRTTHDRLRIAQGDILDGEAVASAVKGQAGVISALGPAAGTPAGTLISDGTRHIIEGMRHGGVRRFVLASGLMVGPAAGMGPFKRLLISIFRLKHRALYLDKVRTEAAVRDSGLDWLIVRPPVLADLPARGRYRVGPDLDVRLMDKLAFGDAAGYMVRALTEDEFLRQAVELSY